MILSAAAYEHNLVLWLILLFASAGVLDHSGIKVPFFSFFYHDSGRRTDEAPWPMLAAMGITAALCIGIGIWPAPLYAILPFGSEYHPYTPGHVVGQFQLLFFAALAFVTLMRLGWYPPEVRGLNLDTDWLYRRAAPWLWRRLRAGGRLAIHAGAERRDRMARAVHARMIAPLNENELAAPWPLATSIVLLLLLLAMALLSGVA